MTVFYKNEFVNFAAKEANSYMSPLTPEEVLRTISADFVIQGITHSNAADRLGFKNKQTLSNLLSSKKYLSERQATKFSEIFGYDKVFLMTGEGRLRPGVLDAYLDQGLSSSLQGLAYNKETGEFHLINESQIGDIDQMLFWVREVFSRQGNVVGLAIWAEISRFAESRQTVENSMKGYDGTNYRHEFDVRLFNLRSEIVENIERMINNIKKGS